MKTKTAPHIAALSLALSSDGAVVQLLPSGTFDAPRGALAGQGPWKLTAAAAARVIANVGRRINDMLIDYEHQSLLCAQNGKPVPAAGWIKPNSLRYDEQRGLFAASVKWTEAAQQAIDADEYRYISPVFSYDKSTGEVLDIINVALTNSPAIDGMDAVTLAAASQSLINLPEESPMDDLLERLRYLFNLPITADAAAISAELDKVKAMISPDMAAAGLPGLLAARDAEIAALKASAPDPAKYAPVAALSAMQTELAALKAKDIDRDVNDLIQPALADGRLLPGQEQWARDLGKSNIAALKSFIETAQSIPALAGMQTAGKQPGGDPSLSGDALVAACKTQWDATPSIRNEFATLEDFTAYKKAEAAGQIKTHGAK